jgi:hypothetical protein
VQLWLFPLAGMAMGGTLKGWWSPARAADAAGDHLPELLPVADTSLEQLFLMSATTPSCCCLPNLRLPVRSLFLSPFVNSFEFPFPSIMLDVLAVQIMHKSLVPSGHVVLGLGFDPNVHLDY